MYEKPLTYRQLTNLFSTIPEAKLDDLALVSFNDSEIALPIRLEHDKTLDVYYICVK